MKVNQRIKEIESWIKTYSKKHKIKTLIVGVSGGIDSAVVSTLCARTGLDVIALSMPILQSKHTHDLSVAHCEWLKQNFSNVQIHLIDLTAVFKKFKDSTSLFDSDLGYANSRARLRMMTLYQVAQSNSGIVVGTGNRVEDFGVGFFTKYGDGGVDISPIGGCYKTEVWEMGKELGIIQDIIDAPPTDGLWDDTRTDQDQLGMSYEDLEKAMQLDSLDDQSDLKSLDRTQRSQLKAYREIRARNMHKMLPIPVCTFD